jgi:hypothetical protein
MRQDLTPSSAIPIAYFALAHVGLAAAFLVLLANPGLPGGVFYQPRVIALVHLVTLVWISGSILGAFYIVGPLALRLPMPAGPLDWTAFGVFALGASGMISHFWMAEYDGMAWSAALVVCAFGWVSIRAWIGLPRAVAPWPVKLHVGLAFANIHAAAAFGILIGLDRFRGFLHLSPLAATYAHAHLAAVGWAAMMVVGLGYRLIPMMLPSAMPTGRWLALSAVLMQIGLVIVFIALLRQSAWLPLGGGLIVAGLASFVVQIRATVAKRRPRPPALPRRDWSVWQAHAALLWLLVAVVVGMVLTFDGAVERRATLIWCYGVAGLVGFLAQMVVGIQGRLVPMYAWHRALAARQGAAPGRSANDLPSAPFARAIFLCWLAGVPALGFGLAHQSQLAIVIASASLLCGVCVSGANLARMLRAASSPHPPPCIPSSPAEESA